MRRVSGIGSGFAVASTVLHQAQRTASSLLMTPQRAQSCPLGRLPIMLSTEGSSRTPLGGWLLIDSGSFPVWLLEEVAKWICNALALVEVQHPSFMLIAHEIAAA